MGSYWGRALVACGVLSAIGIWACSQGDPQPPYIPDSPKADAAATSQGDAASTVDANKNTCSSDDGGCSTLLNCGPRVFVVNVATVAPQMLGGTVPDGTYLLTDYRIFTGAGGTNGPTTVWFTQTMSLTTEATDAGPSDGSATQQMIWERISTTSTDPTPISSTGTAFFSATNSAINVACPSSTTPLLSSYSVTGTQVVMLIDDGATQTQLTYTKQ